MAGGQERVLRRRIKSVQSTKKITKAMELIAASRIVKAQARVAAARPYAERITEVIRNLAAAGASSSHPLLQPRPEINSIAYVVITSDRGLCGAYNSGVLRLTERTIAADRAAGRTARLFVVGKKGSNYLRFRGVAVEQSFLGVVDQPTYEHARQIARAVAPLFDSGEIDAVDLVFNEFLSAGSQRVVIRRLMPLDTSTLEQTEGPAASYEFEPSPDGILDELLPRYVEARLFAALLNASASYHAFQQRAMKAASDNADELIKNLSRVMNRARQDAITTEIMEIVGGAEALRAGAKKSGDLMVDATQTTDMFADR